MLSKSSWILPTALLVVFLLLFEATGASVFLVAAGLAFLGTVALLWRDFKPRDKYDLGRLRDLEDKEELANLDPSVGVFEFDDYLCPYCRTIYSSELRKCPNCGRTRSS